LVLVALEDQITLHRAKTVRHQQCQGLLPILPKEVVEVPLFSALLVALEPAVAAALRPSQVAVLAAQEAMEATVLAVLIPVFKEAAAVVEQAVMEATQPTELEVMVDQELFPVLRVQPSLTEVAEAVEHELVLLALELMGVATAAIMPVGASQESLTGGVEQAVTGQKMHLILPEAPALSS